MDLTWKWTSVEATLDGQHSLYSTIHGTGRVMSRKEAAGAKKWKKVKGSERKELVTVREGKASRDMMRA